jgi:D-alanyl-D-alanine carboxypeptidase
VLSYVEKNKISLDDPIHKYIDSTLFKNIAWFDSVRIKNLLDHTSGIPDYTKSPSWITSVMQANPPNDFKEKISLVNVPDSTHHFGQFAYSNTNYVILEEIITLISQRNARDVFNDYYAGLNLPTITFKKPNQICQTYFSMQKDQTSDISGWDENYGFEGGAYASADDLSKLLRMTFIDKSILDSTRLSLLTRWGNTGKNKIDYGFGQMTKYGLGVMRIEFDGRIFIGHSGSSLKYQSFAFIEPSTGSEIVMLTNCSGKFYNRTFFIGILGEIAKEFQE